MFDWLSSLLPKPIKRAHTRQQQVNEETNRLTLYYLPLCPYCTKVNRVIRQLTLNIEPRNLASSTTWRDELRRGGGKIQAPCLRIQNQETYDWLYESDDIIHYLKQRFTTSEDMAEEYSD